VSNWWDKILTASQYNELTDEKKKYALEHWRKIHSMSEIKKALGWTDYASYKEFDRLGIEVQKRERKQAKSTIKKEKPAPKKPAAKKQAALNIDPAKDPSKNEVIQAAKEVAEAALEILPARNSGATFYLDDTFTPEEAISKLMKYAAFLEGEPHKVKIRLEITEVKK
jgi:hypothetical protein